MAGGLKNIVHNCKAATLISLKKEDGDITTNERARLFIHLLFCDACKQFIKQSALINKLLRQLSNSLPAYPPHKLSAEIKEKIQQQLNS